MPADICATCAHCHYEIFESSKRARAEIVDGPECRAHPPLAEVGWPAVSLVDWCGEYHADHEDRRGWTCAISGVDAGSVWVVLCDDGDVDLIPAADVEECYHRGDVTIAWRRSELRGEALDEALAVLAARGGGA